MSAPGVAFLAALKDAADDAAAVEKTYRSEAAERIRALEQARAFAYRKWNVMRPVVEAVTGAESEEIAVAAGQAVLRSRLGWTSDSEARGAVLSQFAPVAAAIFGLRSTIPDIDESASNVREALTAFEQWYTATYAVPFWSLFEQPMPETPLVDF
jgi:hypothetical protein